MRLTYEENWKLVHELREQGMEFTDIKKKINYGGTIKKLMQLFNAPPLSQRETKNIKDRERKTKNRKCIIDYFGGKCKRCGFSDVRALQIDHVNGGGNREVKSIGNFHIYKNLLARIDAGEIIKDYQLLCANCNWIKRFENDEQPHRVRVLSETPSKP